MNVCFIVYICPQLPNGTWWESTVPFDSPAALVRAVGKAIVLGLLILSTVVGQYTHLYLFRDL